MDVKTLLIFAVGGAVVAFMMMKMSGGNPQEAKRLVEEGATLVDVRSPSEYASGHIDGAVNIPVGELGRRLDELPDKAQPIVVYCRSGARSGSAKSLLDSKGYQKVVNLGGIGAWPKD